MTESNTPTPPEQGKLIPLTPGAMLRDAREQSGQTHAAVGEALHLTVHYIKALENDDYSKLPGLIFVKGYIRSYGHYLKMDVDALIRSYDSHVGALGQSIVQQSQGVHAYDRRQHSRRRSDQSYGWALVAGFIVIVALGAGWWFYGRDQQGAAETSDASSSTSPNTPVAVNRSTAGAQAPGTPFSTATRAVTPPATANTTSTSSTTMAAAIPGTLASTLSQAAGVAGMTNTTTSAGGTVDEGVNGANITTAAGAEIALPTADVTSAATAIAPTGEVIQSAASGTALLQTTVTEDGITVIPSADGTRQLSMFRAGNDELQLQFAGDSWVEIDDASNVRLYSDMLNTGDTLTIQGTAPFQVLLGNARAVQVNFNDSAVDIAASIREDNTARVQLANPSNEAPVAGTGVAQ